MEGEEAGTGLRFGVLGPVRAWRDGEPRAVGSPQQRAVLAALLLRAGRTATAQELVDAVWGEDAPSGAVATLRTYAFRLRKELGPDVLVSDAGGYSLCVAPEHLDLARCEQHAAAAEQARDGGDPAKARELLGTALENWEGEPLAGVPGPFAEAQRSRLEEWRVALLETRIELDLDLGRHTEVVAELTALVADHPLRERLRGLLMLALYRGGRQAEALGVFADTRRLLADELGVDPGGELADLHQRILEADAGLTAPHPASAGASARPAPRPAQLPAAVADFTGRTLFVGELGARLTGGDGETADGGHALAISAVAGIGGVGKTTLAVHVAHEARDSYPDGQLYVDLQGQDARPAEADAVLASFLRALGVPDSAIPDGLEDRAALYRSTLDGRRVLVLLDNARDTAHVRPLLPGTPGCAVIVTSRARLADLPGAYLVALDAMSSAEALAFFGRIAGEGRVADEPEAALQVVNACGCLPLAIRIAGSRLAARRSWSVAALAARLADEHRRLDQLKVGDLAVTATFELGYRQLEPEQARAFRLLALPEGPDLSVPAAAAILEAADPFDTEDLLDGLVDIGLLESPAEGRYRFHDLLRLYARQKAEADGSAADRTAALTRLMDFYLATAGNAYRLENPGDRVVEHLVAADRPGLAFGAQAAAGDWLFDEAACLIAAIRQGAALGGGLLTRAADLLQVTQNLGDSGAHAVFYEQVVHSVVAAAAGAGDARSERRARGMLGQSHQMAGRVDEAAAEAVRVLAMCRGANDPVAEETGHNVAGIGALYGGELDAAGRHFTAALEVCRADGNRLGRANALCNLTRVYLGLGEPARAVSAIEEVVATYRELGASHLVAVGYYNQGLVLAANERRDEALVALGEALALFRAGRQHLWEGMSGFRMAEINLAGERPARAADLAEQALILLHDLVGGWRRAQILALLGDALARLGQPDRARACRSDALAIFEELDSPEAADVRAALEGHPGAADGAGADRTAAAPAGAADTAARA